MMDTVERRRASALRRAIYYRNYRRARERALVRLAQAYPDEYKIYLEQERAKDEKDGKTWTSLSDGLSGGSIPRATQPHTKGILPDYIGEEGDDGGEA